MNYSDALPESILKTTIVANAINYGWTVKYIDTKTIILRKKLNQMKEYEKNTSLMLDLLFDMHTHKID